MIFMHIFGYYLVSTFKGLIKQKMAEKGHIGRELWRGWCPLCPPLFRRAWSCYEFLKMSWRRFYKTFWRSLEDILKKSSRHLQDVLAKLTTYDQDKYISLYQDVLRTSWRSLLKKKMKDVFQTSSSRKMFSGLS